MNGHVLVLQEIAKLIKPSVAQCERDAGIRARDLFGEIAKVVFQKLDLSYVADEVRLIILRELHEEMRKGLNTPVSQEQGQ